MIIDKTKYIGKFDEIFSDGLEIIGSDDEGICWRLYRFDKYKLDDPSLFYALVKKSEYGDESEFNEYVSSGDDQEIQFEELIYHIKKWNINFATKLSTRYFENLKVNDCVLVENDDDLLEAFFVDEKSLNYLNISIT